MSLTYRLKRTGEINPPWATAAPMPRRDDVAAWKDASNVRSLKKDEIYGLCKTGSWRALACRGGHRSRRYRRLWPRRGKLRRWASFRRNAWLFFKRGGFISLVRMGSFYYGRLLSSLHCHWLVGRADRRGFLKVVSLAGGRFLCSWK